MINLSEGGAYLLHGTEIIEDGKDAAAVLQNRLGSVPSKEDAAKGTIAYSILEKHNTSDNMEQLKIKFDKLTSHDITFVGIIQTARASGLEKFPIPYVLTNCHNSLCAVGGTINEDDHMFGRRICASSSGGNPSVCQRNASGRRQNDPWLGQSYKVRSTRYNGGRRRRS